MKLILASSSPRRIALLKQAEYEFESVKPKVDETLEKELPIPLAVEQVALRKALSIKSDEALVIGADTVVVFEDQVLGKPKDFDDAQRMLRMLSDKTHEVITGVALVYQQQPITFHDVSHVTFMDLSDKWIDEYILHYHPLSKAGSYGVQDDSYENKFVKEIVGDMTNVVGLPMKKLSKMLKELEQEAK